MHSWRRPGSGDVWNSRCWTRGLWGEELDKAEADCEAALKLSPKDAAYIDSYGLVALRSGRHEEAIRRYSQALEINPKEASSLYMRGVARQLSGDVAGGAADMAAAKTFDPGIADMYARFGIAP